MTSKELEKAKKPKNLKALMERLELSMLSEPSLMKDYQITAYNFMIDYLEHPEWFLSHEGERLVTLSLEVLREI